VADALDLDICLKARRKPNRNHAKVNA
jgi:hypothetical protein